jgi:hypothetical protein
MPALQSSPDRGRLAVTKALRLLPSHLLFSSGLPGDKDLLGVFVGVRGVDLEPPFERVAAVFGVRAFARPLDAA